MSESDLKSVSAVNGREYSIVIPVHNEEDSLPVLFEEIRAAMKPLGQSYEVVFVNDGSTDRSLLILQDFQKNFSDVVRIISLETRSGQTHALLKGLREIKGNFVITLDADLQNDPADIPRLIEKMREGYDAVCGWRKARQDKLLKAVLSKSGNILQRLLTGLRIHDVSCTLRLYKRELAEHIPLNWEGQHRFIPLCLSLQGFRVGEIVSNHRNRRYGVTKYSHKRIFKVVVDFFKILIHRGRK